MTRVEVNAARQGFLDHNEDLPVGKELKMIERLIELRKELHRYPELSEVERMTAKKVKAFITAHYPPTCVIDNLGGHGFAVIYEFGTGGATVAIRCELDALPILEVNTFSHKSTVNGVSHKCGHDGHMAIVAGLVFWIKEQAFDSGKIVLLFQPAEETGRGAIKVLEDIRFRELNCSHLFALHNIPGVPLHSIVTMVNGFSAEVQSCSVRIEGKECHASAPENGINPALGMAEIITALAALNVHDPVSENFAILTPVHSSMGQKSYGISPAKAELHYTLRTWSAEKMSALKTDLEQVLQNTNKAHDLTYRVDWFEHFPASKNDADCQLAVIAAASENGYSLVKRPYPFKFGEDFGWFSKNFKSAMFGLGAGEDIPDLHNADYDFPDELLETGIAMFASIIGKLLRESSSANI